MCMKEEICKPFKDVFFLGSIAGDRDEAIEEIIGTVHMLFTAFSNRYTCVPPLCVVEALFHPQRAFNHASPISLLQHFIHIDCSTGLENVFKFTKKITSLIIVLVL